MEREHQSTGVGRRQFLSHPHARSHQEVQGQIRSGHASESRYPARSTFSSDTTINSGEIDMAKGEQRGNREAKKPKKEKIKVIAAAPRQKTGSWQQTLGSGKKR